MDSDCEMTSSNSSSDRCSSLDRLSFDVVNPRKISCAALGSDDFKLIRRIGSGDIGTVFLCKLRTSKPLPASHNDDHVGAMYYAMKVVDREVLRRKKKTERADVERRILRDLDHPFLPRLYAEFEAGESYSCVVMEYCSGGDLHSLRHRQAGRRFSIPSARFYAAEVLLALEYLHMLGIVYRDLKPENILIRSDGHVMLSDFDLSLLSAASPHLVDPTKPKLPHRRRRFFCRSDRPRSPEHRRFVAEPVGARSSSFVGTHEYVAPEVASGGPHGNAVDWWAYGVLLYELIYGRTPFAGPTNESTLRNIVRKPLSFPTPGCEPGDRSARDLISGLLVKDPSSRLGSRFGAADVKGHPFFKGLNWALMRSVKPPFVPGLKRVGSDRQKSERFDYF